MIHVYAFVGAGLLPMIGSRKGTRWLYDCQTSAIKPPLLRSAELADKARVAKLRFAITVLSEGIRDIVFGPAHAGRSDRAAGGGFRPVSSRYHQIGRCVATTASRPRTASCLLRHARSQPAHGETDRGVRFRRATGGLGPAAGPRRRFRPGELKQQARVLNLGDRVLFTGLIPYDRDSRLPVHHDDRPGLHFHGRLLRPSAADQDRRVSGPGPACRRLRHGRQPTIREA